MITNIFGKSNPMNFVLCGLLISVAFGFVFFNNNNPETETITVAVLPILLLLGFMIDFVAKKNKITENDSYSILIFTLLLFLFPSVFIDFPTAISNLFILFALRRLISLQSHLQVKQKIFDASFWIAIATVFEFWSILYLIAVYVSIVIYVSRDFKNWIIPFVGLITVFVLVTLCAFVFDLDVLTPAQMQIDFGFDYLTDMFHSFSLGVFLSVYLLFLIFQVMAMGNYLATLQNLVKIILLWLIIGLFVYLISDQKHNGLLLYCFAPLALIGSNFISSLRREWFKEAFIIALIVLGVTSFVLV